MQNFISTLLASAVAATALCSAATASTVPLPTGFGDVEFNELCDEGGFVFACEVAVAELRAGDTKPSGDIELVVRQPTPGNPFGGPSGNLAIASDVPLDFLVDYSAAQTFSLTVGGATTSSDLTNVDMSGVNTLFVRLSSRGGGSFEFTELAFNGESLGAFPPGGVSYIAFQADSFTDPFQVTGSVIFSFEDGDKLGSNLATQLKFTDVDFTPVPLPAGLPLVLGGLGALAWLKRRQKRAT